MDPVSVVGLVAATHQIVAAVAKFGQGVREAKGEINRLCSELLALKGALEHVQLISVFGDLALGDKDAQPATSLFDANVNNGALSSSNLATPEFRNMLVSTQEILEELQGQLEKKPSRLKDPLRMLAWPLRKPDIDRYVARLERAKSWFILAVTTDNTALCRESYLKICSIDRRLERQEGQEEQRQLAFQRRLIRNWIAPHNYELAYERALSVFQRRTGAWFLHGVYQNWLQGQVEPILWLRAKPGSGKTTLLSAAIEQAKILHDDPSSASVAYAFCSFAEQESQDVQNVFGALVAQICDQNPELWTIVEVNNQALASQSQHTTRRLDSDDLVDALSHCLRGLPAAILVLDAVNESKESGQILQCLHRLIANNDNVKILFSSTEDFRADSATASAVVVTMGDDEIAHDIALYIEAQLEDTSKFQSLPLRLKLDICRVLQEKADGSFRFVQCQLEALAHQNTARDIRTALHHIPSTLEQTYRDILARIPKDETQVVRRALLWIGFSLNPMTFEALCEAVIVPEEESYIDDDMRLLHPQKLLTTCSSLIAYDTNNTKVNLAHSSVWYYLTSEGLKNSDVAEFYLDRDAADGLITRYCLNYLFLPAFTAGYCLTDEDLSERFDNWPLLRYVANTLYDHLAFVHLDEPMQSLLLRLFSTHNLPRGGNYGSWVQAFDPNIVVVDTVNLRLGTIRSSTPLYYAARAGLLPVVKLILAAEGNKHLETPGGTYGSTPLHVAAWQGHIEVVRELLKAGADPHETNQEGYNCLHWALKYGFHDIVRLLRDAGAPEHGFKHCEESSPTPCSPDPLHIGSSLPADLAGGHKLGSRRVWICNDISKDHSFLAGCKQCQSGKQYNSYYNAAAHLRRVHFDPKMPSQKDPLRRYRGRLSTSMETLKMWMKVVEIPVTPQEESKHDYSNNAVIED